MKSPTYLLLAAFVVLIAFSSSWLWRGVLSLSLLCFLSWIKPKSFHSLQTPDPHRKNLLCDKYDWSKVPANLDAIVIGSGMSGLTCAAILSRMGKRVLVLEQHEQTCGGGTHTYALGKNGAYVFDSGLHYTVPESSLLLQLCTGTAKPPVDCDLLGERDENGHLVYDRVLIGENKERFDIKLHQKHLPELYRMFPENKSDIDRYIQVAKSTVDSIPCYVLSRLFPRWIQRLLAPCLLRNFRQYAKLTTQEALQSITNNPKLASIFGSMWINTGSPPHRATFMLGAAVFFGFPERGGAYPAGGSQSMPACLVPVIERAGGRVLIKASVSQILVEEKAAVGVRMVTGEEIRAPLVISSVGYHNSVQLLSPDVCSRLNIPVKLPVDPSAGFVMVNIGINADRKDMNLQCMNTWLIPTMKDGCMFSALEQHWKDPLAHPELIPMMITFPSLKDRKWGQNHPGKETCQLLVMAEGSHFLRWRDEKCGLRSESYQELKQRWSDACINRLLDVFPQLRPHIDFVDISTPLTIEHYLKGEQGGAVGLDQTPSRFLSDEIQSATDTCTPVTNLYFTGQDFLICGVPLVQIAGVLTALRILGPVQGLRFMLQNIFFELPQTSV